MTGDGRSETEQPASEPEADRTRPEPTSEGPEVDGRPRKTGPDYRIPPDEEVVAAAVKTILRTGTIDSQRKLGEMVARTLRERDPRYRVSPERVRVLALRSGLIGVHVHAHATGEAAGKLKWCPVCESALERTANRTLGGGAASTGYRCSRCPWWTGRDYRVPSRYVFHAIVERRPESPQVAFKS